jgi:hypothetical protein
VDLQTNILHIMERNKISNVWKKYWREYLGLRERK